MGSLLSDEGLELFDVQFRREAHGWVLRVFVDASGGVTLDHCSVVSRELGQYLDVEDVIDHAYTLEVSSPGLERPLQSIEDFVRFEGKKARVKFHEPVDGKKIYEGVIGTVTVDQISMKMEDGYVVEFSLDMINKARLAI